MHSYEADEIDQGFRLVIRRAGGTRMRVNLLFLAMLGFFGYGTWKSDMRTGHRELDAAILAFVCGTGLTWLAWSTWQLCQPEEWLFDRVSGAVQCDGSPVASLTGLLRVVVQRSVDSEREDLYTLFLERAGDKRVTVDYVYGREGARLGVAAERIAAYAGVPLVREEV